MSSRWKRRLLKLYPAEFRENYGEAMKRAFRDELRELWGVVLWLRLLADLAVSLPAQLTHEIAQDTRHAFRLWRARAWRTGFAILALAVGIGANTGVFSVVSALLLPSLPFRDPDRLESLRYLFPPHDSAAQFHAWRSQSAYLEDAALIAENDANLGGAGEWRRAHVVQTICPGT